jgi:sigma-E factor negative regulatory protein RseA
LVDGEVNDIERQQALRALGDDPALRGHWERYHLVGAALRRELDVVVRPGLADRIHAQLGAEPPARAGSGARLFKLGVGMAIAAGVAAVAVVNLPPVLAPGNTVATSPAPGAKTLVADVKPLPPDKQQALNPYLVQHGEFTPAAGMNGISSYVRLVGHQPASAENPNAE